MSAKAAWRDARAFLGVDIGTQGVKAAAFDADGRLLAESFRPSDLKRPAPGAVEEDPERQVRSVCETIAECAAKIGAEARAARTRLPGRPDRRHRHRRPDGGRHRRG